VMADGSNGPHALRRNVSPPSSGSKNSSASKQVASRNLKPQILQNSHWFQTFQTSCRSNGIVYASDISHFYHTNFSLACIFQNTGELSTLRIQSWNNFKEYREKNTVLMLLYARNCVNWNNTYHKAVNNLF
jgi:hypothetical protein